MAVGAPRTEATGISIAIARDPSLVRTVRLVAAAVARRASTNENLVEEVRLAVGEACAVMVSGLVGAAGTAGDKVRLQIDIAERLFISLDCPGDTIDADTRDGTRVDPWALLRGLAADLVVTTREGSTRVAMSWPC
jgi:hypothetical protein